MIGLGGLSIPLNLLDFFLLLFFFFFLFFFLNQDNVLNVMTVLTLHNIEPPAPELGPSAAFA